MSNGIEVYEGYLDEVIDLPEECLSLETDLMERWRQREDGAAFVDRGDRLTEQSTSLYQEDPQRALSAGISCYQQALRFYSPERSPLNYAMTQNNLGIAYRNLAGYQEPVENLNYAVQAYSEALRFLTPERSPLDYAMTQNNLGNAYQSLAGYQEPVENLGRAVQACSEALRFRTPERSPLDYAMTQNNLGNAYQSLAGYQEPVENLNRAVQACSEALRFRTPERSPLDYAMTQNNLGNAYQSLAGYQEPVENLNRAVQAYNEALRFLTSERSPLDYAATQNNLGNAYQSLAGYQEPVENLNYAVQAYNEALRFYTSERSPLNYATTQNNLGHTYGLLGKTAAGIESFENALAVYRKSNDWPRQSALLIKLAQAYIDVDNKEKSVECTRELERLTTEPGNNLNVWNDIGNIYSKLEEREQSARAYGEAIQRSPNDAWLYRNRASEFIYLANWAAAEADLAEAAKLEPEHPYLKGRKGDLAFWQKQFASAAHHYEEATQSAEDVDWKFALALSHVGTGDTERAKAAFDSALSAANGDEKKELLSELRRARSILQESELLDQVEQELSKGGL